MYFTFGVLVGLGNNFISIGSSYMLILKYFPDENAVRATALSYAGSTAGKFYNSISW